MMSEPQSEPNPNPKLFTEPTEEPFGRGIFKERVFFLLSALIVFRSLAVVPPAGGAAARPLHATVAPKT